jgi:folate-binding protein YgfZ
MMFLLKDRTIIEISGQDRQEFLQGLITNDIKLANSLNMIYSAFLNGAGRFFGDFFIHEIDEKYILDCHILEVDDIIKKLNLYKLRSQIEIKKNENLFVIFNTQSLGFIDPRANNFGFRFYVNEQDLKNYSTQDLILYHQRRIDFKIPEGYYDLTKDKSYIFEFGFDNFNAISYQKGCYVGQEATARNHYRGQLRKKIFLFEIKEVDEELRNIIEEKNDLSSLQFDGDGLKMANIKNHELLKDGKDCGLVLSSIFDGKTLRGLALLKFDEVEDEKNILQKIALAGDNIFLQNNKILIID